MSDQNFLLPWLHKAGPNPDRGHHPTVVVDGQTIYRDDEDEFIRAVSAFRSVNKIGSPTLCQLLWVLKQLGYRKCGQNPADDSMEGRNAARHHAENRAPSVAGSTRRYTTKAEGAVAAAADQRAAKRRLGPANG